MNQTIDHKADVIMTNTTRLHYLDGLRGWASFIVLIGHFIYAYRPELLREAAAGSAPAFGPLSFLADGRLAVSVFFILSAMALTIALNASHARGQQTTVPGLIVKRWVRLALPIAAISLLYWPIFSLTGDFSQVTGGHWLNTLRPSNYRPDFLELMWQSSILVVIGTHKVTYDPFLWTIQVEFYGSLFLFLLCRFTKPLDQGGYRLHIAAASIPFLLFRESYILNFISLFSVGIIFAEIMSRGEFAGKKWRWAIAWASLLVGLLLPVTDVIPATEAWRSTVADAMDQIRIFDNLSQWMIRATLIVGGTLCLPPIQRLLTTGISRYLGAASYPLYLFQGIMFAGPVSALHFYATGKLGEGAALIGSAILLLLTVPLASLLHHYLERPAISLAARAAVLIDSLILRVRRAIVPPSRKSA